MKFLSPVDVDGYISLITQDPGVTPTKFLIQDANGRIAFRTGQELKVDIGADYTSVLKHQVKASVAINKGQAVYAIPTQDGTNILVGLASNNAEATSSKTMGLLNATVVINGFADVITEGLLSGLNTIGATVGDPVWLGTNGNLIYGLANKPYAPNHLVFIGIVTRVNANNGEIFVKVQNGFELDELHDVDLKTTVPVNGHILGHNGTLWVNKTIAGWLGFTPADSARSISTTGPLQGGGDLSANRTLSITQATTSTSGYLSSTDWNTFNNKQNALGYTPYNASNPAGYISSYTETDTLTTVTARGATTSTLSYFTGGLSLDAGQLKFNQNGVRSWNVQAYSGNLNFNSGDGGGNFVFGNTTSFFSQLAIENQGTFARLAFNKLTFWDWQGSGDIVTIDGGYLEAANSLRAPIFYDSNDTAYFIDLNSTGKSGKYAGYLETYASVNKAVLVGNWNGANYWGFGSNGTHTMQIDMVGADSSTFLGASDVNLKLGTNTVLHTGNYLSYTDPIIYRGVNISSDFQTYQSTPGVIRFDQINNTGSQSNAPGGYIYGGVLSLRGGNFGMQLWGSHTGNFFFKTQWDNDQYSGWREVIHTSNYTNYAWPLEGGWKPSSLSGATRLRGATSPDGGEFALAYSGGQIHPYTDGFFYQNEGAYRVMDANSIGDYTYGNFRKIADYSSDSTWFIRNNGRFVFANAHDWTQTLELVLPSGGSNNNTWAQFGQRQSNTTNGNFTGISIRRYINSTNDLGDLQAGNVYATIYYDQNNTGYYVDPSNLSNIHNINVDGTLQVAGEGGNYNEGIRLVSGTGSWSNIQFGANWNGYGTQSNQWIVGKKPDGNFVLSLAGNQESSSRFLIQQDGAVQARTYYDGDNTSYYVNAAGESRLDTVNSARFATDRGSQNPDSSHPGFGIRPFYSWDLGQAYNASAGYSNGITIGSHPGDQSYGFQIVQNMWDDQLYFRRYNAGWQGWRTALDNTNYNGYSNFSGAVYGTIFYDANNTGYYVDPASSSNMNAVYADNWFRTYGKVGVYSQTYAVHFYPYGSEGWAITGSGGNVALQFRSNHETSLRGYVYADTSNNIGFLNNSGNWSFRVDSSGNATATGDVTAYSDRRVKENIHTIDNPLYKILSLRGVYYTRIDLEDKKRKVGVIAQETLEVLPEVVGQDTDGMYNVAYGNMVALLIEGIKEQQTQIEELKQLVNQSIQK